MNPYLEKAIELIKEKKIDISNKQVSGVPHIYYIGMPKAASQSIQFGFPGISVSHWHNLGFFESRIETDVLSKNNLNLYDLVIYIGKKYKFKPLVVECIREPIGMLMSYSAQHLKYEHKKCSCELCTWKRNPERQMNNELLEIIKRRIRVHFWWFWLQTKFALKHCFDKNILKTFDANKNKILFMENKNIKILMIRFEDQKNRKIVFKKLNYDYVEIQRNYTQGFEKVARVYNFVKENK